MSSGKMHMEYRAPDDIKLIATAVLRHRLRLSPDYEIEGYNTDRVLTDILENIEAPRV